MKNLSIVFFICLFVSGLFVYSETAHAVNYGSALTQHWKLDEGVQGTTPVNSGSISESTMLGGGGPTYSTDVPTTSFSNSYSAAFNGVDQYVGANTSVTTSFSLAFWFKTATTGPSISQFYEGLGMVDAEHTAAGDWGMSWGNQKVAFGMNANGPDITIFSTTTQTLSQWHHVVGTWSSETGIMSLYVDGVFNTSTLTTTDLRQVHEMRIGGTQTGTHFFEGQIDDVRIYNTILTTSTIVALSAGGPPPQPSDFSAVASTTNVNLSWTNPVSPSFSSITIRRSTSTYPIFTTDGTGVVSGSVTTTFSDTNLADGRYYYSIFALDAGGNESNPVTSTVLVDNTPPTLPGVPASTSPTSSTLPLISWTASTDAGVGLVGVPYFLAWSTSSDFSSWDAQTSVTNIAVPYHELTEGTWYFRVHSIDGNLNTTAFVTSSAIVIDRTAPTITILGSNTIDIYQGQIYNDAGATANDIVSGNLTNSIVTTNNVSNISGSYTVTYTVTDAAGNTASTYRTVNVHAAGGISISVLPTAQNGSDGKPEDFNVVVNGITTGTAYVQNPILTLTFNGDNNVKGYSLSLNPDFVGANFNSYSKTTSFELPHQSGDYVLYAKFYSSTGNASQVVKRIINYNSISSNSKAAVKAVVGKSYAFNHNLKFGSRGKDVLELQRFLNSQGFVVSQSGAGSPGNESSFYGFATVTSVKKFQEAHANEILAPLGLKKGTGFFYSTTRALVNGQ